MGITDLYKSRKDVQIKDIEKLISELKDVQMSIVAFTNDSQIDIEIAEMIGKLKAQNPDELNGETIIEFLVYLSDKTKTKADGAQTHYTETMMKVIHAKIELLLIYHTGLIKGSVLRQIFSMSTVWPILVVVIFSLVALVTIHKYDPSLFIDLGISHKNTTKGNK